MGNNDSRSGKTPNRTIIMDFLEALIVLLLIGCMMFVIIKVEALQGTARVINYTGIVRGATQRLIKLELMGRPNEDLEIRLDGIMEDLQTEHIGANGLILLPDESYKACLHALATAWELLKGSVADLREGIPARDQVLNMSESYFHLADNTVSAAEVYSQELASNIQLYEKFILVLTALEVMLIAYKTINNIRLVKRNRELDRMAYVDAHTGLPNKSRCEQYLNDIRELAPRVAVFMFDLNFLKKVNDELGHDAGDSLIKNFAMILRNNVPSHHFVGRFGGDEFIVIANGADRQDAEKIANAVAEATAKFNSTDRGYTLSFSCGYAISDDFPECTYKTLFDKADYNMYENKRAMKAKLGTEMR